MSTSAIIEQSVTILVLSVNDEFYHKKYVYLLLEKHGSTCTAQNLSDGKNYLLPLKTKVTILKPVLC